MTCIVTIHGIGFQRAPEPENHIPGYADGLHQRLKPLLVQRGLSLGDDPDPRRRDQPGPVYVQSHFPAASRDQESGLCRLDEPLFEGQHDVGHVALVYSHLEDLGPQLDVTFETLGKVAVGAHLYTTAVGALRMLLVDLEAMRVPPPEPETADSLPRSLMLRPRPQRRGRLWRLFHRGDQPAAEMPTGPLALLRTLENDVAAYVCRNELRERVRSFVRQSLHRLAARDDIERIVVNSHSQGTVVAYDVLREDSTKVSLFVTAGSPLRKYVDLFTWGTEAGALSTVPTWLNFWDTRDPVADPLDPPASWRRGRPLPPLGANPLYQSLQLNGDLVPVPIHDEPADNVLHSLGSDLRAHNYWDNAYDVLPKLAAAL